MSKGIDLKELDKETAEKLGVLDDWQKENRRYTRSSKSKFSVQDERSWAIKALQPLSGLSDTERKRVMKRAIKMTEA